MMHITGTSGRKVARWLIIAAMLTMAMIMLPSCGSNNDSGSTDENGSTSESGSTVTGTPFAGKEVADLSDYSGMIDYDGESRLIETDVAEVVKLINDKETFVVFFSFADCPYCNMIIPYVNQAAEEADQYVGYVNTRKDPSWTNNMDIDNYDLVVKYFGDYLKKDEDGKDHLYTPDMYFIKNGEVVARHDGVVEGADDPSQPLTNSQIKTLMNNLREEFATLK